MNLETARKQTIDPVQRNRMRDDGLFEAAAIPFSPGHCDVLGVAFDFPFWGGSGPSRCMPGHFKSNHFGYHYRPDPPIFSKVESFVGLCQS